MNNSVKYGLMYGIIPALIMLLVYVLGFNRDESALTFIRWFSVLIYAAILYVGIKTKRDDEQNGFLKFGQGFSTGFMIVLIGSLIGTLMSIMYFTVIDPGFREFLVGIEEQKLYDSGQSQEQIDTAMPYIEKFMTLPIMMGIGLFFNLLLGCALTLIGSIVLKKEDPNEMVG